MRLSPKFAVLSVALAGLAATSANAMLVFEGTVDVSGTGLGAVNTVLTLQSPANSDTETGSVGRMAGSSTDVTAGDAGKGASQTRTRTLGDLGLTSASDLRIVFNPNEPGNAASNGISLNDLQLTIYSPTGTVLFSSGAFNAQSFNQTLSGTGSAGLVFKLDDAQAAQAQLAAFGAGSEGNFVGLSASATSATGGPETFYVAAAPVPEPQAILMLVPGLAVLVGVMKRRRRTDEA